MNSQFLIALLENLTKLIALSAISQVINVLNEKNPFYGALIRGVVFGMVGVLIMHFPYTLTSGITFDSRSILLSLTALFYSLPTTLIVTATLLVYRIMMGGSGMIMGIMVILTSSALGLLWKTQPRINFKRGTWIEYYTLGLAVHLIMCAYMFLLPKAVINSTLINVGIPVLITYPLVTIIVGKLFSFQIIQNEQQEEIILGEKKIRNIYDNAPIGIVNLNLETKIICMNKAFCEMSGYQTNELLNIPLTELVVLENAEETAAIIRQMKAKKLYDYSADRLLKKKDGQRVWVTLSVTRIDDPAKTGGHFIATLQDINSRKESEQLNDYLRYHDQLTGAYNPKYLDEKATEWNHTGITPRYFVCIDVNNLRIVNDAFGFKAGDELLRKVYQGLYQTCAEYGKIVRFKSSEFLLYVFNLEELKIENIIRDIRSNLSELVVENVEVSVSIGIAEMNSDTNTLSEMLILAEDNMRKDKLLSMDRSVSNTIEVIMKSLFAKNSREMLHSQRVSSICVDICRKMGLDKYNIEKARIAGLMHDIGKIGIPETILDKPSGLSIDERNKIQEHATIGYRILSSTNEFAEISDIILSHHERWDGTGYPRGLEKEAIPLFARIISIADTFDAMTSERPYRQPFTMSEALSEIKTMSGKQFDPEVVDVFLSVMADSNPGLFS